MHIVVCLHYMYTVHVPLPRGRSLMSATRTDSRYCSASVPLTVVYVRGREHVVTMRGEGSIAANGASQTIGQLLGRQAVSLQNR